MVKEILRAEPITNRFEWLNSSPSSCQKGYDELLRVFTSLEGNIEVLRGKKPRALTPDAYFPPPWNFIFEFDELQHFTKYKKIALENYPPGNYGFEINEYKRLCEQYQDIAIRKGPAGYRVPKPEFPFENGRAAQRAFFDACRDILPQLNGLNPTVRISEFEVKDIIFGTEREKQVLREILRKRKVVA